MKQLSVEEIKAMIRMTKSIELVRQANTMESIDFTFPIDSRVIVLSFDNDDDKTGKMYVDETETFKFDIDDLNLARFSQTNDDRKKLVSTLKTLLKV